MEEDESKCIQDIFDEMQKSADWIYELGQEFIAMVKEQMSISCHN